MKEQINAKMVTILNICLPQVVDWIVVSKNAGTPAFVSVDSRPREIFLSVVKK